MNKTTHKQNKDLKKDDPSIQSKADYIEYSIYKRYKI